MSSQQKCGGSFPMNGRRSSLRSRGKVQDFEKLHSAALKSGKLFEDDEFPASNRSLYFSRSPPGHIKWLRPHEMVSSPKFISDGATRFDVQQGELGDCWFLAALDNLTLNQKLLHRVVPQDQSFDNNYAGIVKFRLWRFGKWEEVVIDDRLPTHNGSLIFLKSPDNQEFWTPLLEKAYAKLAGSYEALDGGFITEAMVDFTGGVCEVFSLSRVPDDFHKIMMEASRRGSLMGCAITPDPNAKEAILRNGLVCGHAYSVTKVFEADAKTRDNSGKLRMVRVRNPWGSQEWKGKFRDQCNSWRYVSKEDMKEMDLTFEHDGEFWMTYDDFINNFMTLDLCSLGPDSFDETFSSTRRGDITDTDHWETEVFEGSWVRGVSAGGCQNYSNSYHRNPKYKLTLKEADDEDDDGKCTIIVSLMQKNRRALREKGRWFLPIGYSIYKLPDSGKAALDQQFFYRNAPVAHPGDYTSYREVTSRFKLPPGSYVVIPTTFEPNQEGDFIVRVFSEKANDMAEVDDDENDEIDAKNKEEVKLKTDPDIMKLILEIIKQIVKDFQLIDYLQLQKILDSLRKEVRKFGDLSKDTCRSMVALMDVDNSGKFDIESFMELWDELTKWIDSFNVHEKDDSDNLLPFEFEKAVKAAGFKTNKKLLKCLMHRYGDNEGQITFDDFIAMSVRLKRYNEICSAQITNKCGDAPDNEWMEHFICA